MCAVATPKQIRELMKVDGLTNDEVKSQHQVNNLALSLIHVIKIHCRCLLCGLLTWILCFWCFFRNNGCTTGGRLDPVW
jgi:hypothetical protein